MKEDIRVGDVMTKGVMTLDSGDSVLKAAKTLRENTIGSVVVLENGKAVGILTERDIAFKVVAEGADPKKTLIKSIMGKPLKVISADTGLQEAALALKTHKIKRLPVIDKNEKLVGIITEDDMLRIYPGFVDIVRETSQIKAWGESEVLTGVCESCGIFSEELKAKQGRLLCVDCMQELEE